jgi:hypothetical protein
VRGLGGVVSCPLTRDNGRGLDWFRGQVNKGSLADAGNDPPGLIIREVPHIGPSEVGHRGASRCVPLRGISRDAPLIIHLLVNSRNNRLPGAVSQQASVSSTNQGGGNWRGKRTRRARGPIYGLRCAASEHL